MSDPMEAFRARFRARCRSEALQLVRGPDAERRTIAHRIAGMGGTLGYNELSAMARDLDETYAAGRTPCPAALERLIEALRALRD